MIFVVAAALILATIFDNVSGATETEVPSMTKFPGSTAPKIC